MLRDVTQVGLVKRTRKQRNLFRVLAICAVISIGVSVPRKIESYRELKSVNAHLIALQAAIVDNQQRLLEIQAKIIQDQDQIRKHLQQ